MKPPISKNAPLLLAWLAATSLLSAQVGPWVHVAGSGSTAAGGPDNIPATTAAMRPLQLSFDAAGNLHLADANGRISRVNKVTGIITTVAGGGTGAFGGPATGVALNAPCGVRVDNLGNVLISESCYASSGGGTSSSFGRLSKVATSGVISTVAGIDGIPGYSGDGGPAISARLNIPIELTTDATGNIFFTDILNHVVRRIDAATGVITRVAGLGSAGYGGDGSNALNWDVLLNNPTSVAVDASGNIYIADQMNARIRRISAATGIITTAVGTGTPGFNGEGRQGPATQINRPSSLTVDSAGNLYFSDTYYPVRRLDAVTGVVSTVFPVSYPGSGPFTTVAVGPDQKIYYTEGSQVFSRQLPTGAPATLLFSMSPATHLEPYTNVTVTAQISPTNATGSVQFLMNGLQLTTVPLVNGVATTTISTGSSGFALGVAYAGAPGFLPAVAPTVDVPVKYLPALSVTSNLNPAAPGQAVTLTANLSMGSGNVEFLDSAISLGTVYVAGTGSLTTSALTVGSHNITARFPGDTSLHAVTSPVLVQTIAAPTTVALTANPLTPNAGQAVTLTATVTPVTATGTVEFFDGANVLGSGTLASGVASFTATSLSAGAHSLTARYNGNNSPVVPVTVKAVSSLAVTSSANPATLASPVTFTANVTPTTATGVVQFFDGATSLGTSTLAAGSATLTLSTLTGGSHSITVQYAGDANVSTSTSAVLTQTVKTTSSVVLAANPLNAATAQTITLTATVTPATATGAVEFLNGAAVIGSGTLAAGVASFITSTLTVGAHSLTARYNGDIALNSSTSAVATVTIKTAASVVLTANPNPAISTNPTTLTATVTPASATGTVQFLDGGAVVGSAPVTAGVAALTLPSLSANPHTLTAEYSGDSQTATATGTLSLNVLRASTVDLAGPSAVTLGQSTTFAALVGPSGATGTVEFFDNAVSLGSSPVSGGAAQVTITTLALGAHTITATYSGNSTFAGSTSAGFAVAVKTNPSFTLASSANPATVGQSINITATANPDVTGTIQFSAGATVLGSAALVNGSATLTTSTLAAGAHPIGVTYPGDAKYYGGGFGGLSQVVKAVSATALASSAASSNPGQSVTFTATVTPSTATGNVVFLVNGATAATVPLASGVATFSASTLASGSHLITAQYAGDNFTNGSNAGALTQTVRTPTMAALVSNANPSVAGQSVTITATITPATATGSVNLLDNSTVIGTATLNSGVAAFTTSALGAGAHSLTVSYAGSSAHMPSSSATLTQTVNKANSTTVVTSSLNPATAGQAVTFAVTVTPATATGTVQIMNGSVTLATVTLSGGTATYTTPALPTGNRSITAVYSGSTSLNGSTSAALMQRVRIATTLTLTSNRNPALTTQSVTFTAQVSPSTSGSVQFYDGATLLGTSNLSSGRATLTRTGLTVGSHPIQAVYVGNTTHAPSTSPVLNQTIN